MTAGVSGPTRTACPYCGVGCGVVAEVTDDGSVEITGDPDHPANFGRLCSKGAALGETIDLDGRLLKPYIGDRAASWEEALDVVAKKFAQAIRDYGPDSVAMYVSGQILTEDYYVANKLMKGYVGTANIDTNSRLCMASSVAGHRKAFGADTVPGTYEDLEQADLLVLTGSNLAWCHPVLYQRIAAAKEANPSMRIVLIDPRRTATAELADLHLPINADGDVALFLGLLGYLERSGHVDKKWTKANTAGLNRALEHARAVSRADILEQTGITPDALDQFFEWFGETNKVVTVYSQGVNQSRMGTDKVSAILNCHLATGRIGVEGSGPFSVTGQPNAMGGREVGGLANMLAGHLNIEDADHRALVQSFWGSPRMASQPGFKAVDLFEAVGNGQIKALWIMATNPVDSLPEADRVREALKRCDFVVVSDVLETTDTVDCAHVRLPSAAWGEKDGTVTNSERRISRQRGFLPLPGDARADWWQIAEVARRLGYGNAFNWPNAAAVFREHAQLSVYHNNGSRDFDLGDLASISDDDYELMAPVMWPVRADRGDTRFFANGGFYTPDRKARVIPVQPPQWKSRSNGELSLNTGRVRDHWHTMTRTARSPRLSAHLAEPYAEIHPDDADRLTLGDADIARVISQHGEILVRVMVTERVPKGSVFVPMHWTDKVASRARVDCLIPAVTDPFSGQPASKNCAVSVSRLTTKAFGFAIVAGELKQTPDLAYWAVARCSGGTRIEFAHDQDIDDHVAFASDWLGIDATEAVVSRDDARGSTALGWFSESKLRAALWLSPTPVAVSRTWASAQISEEFADSSSRYAVIAGRPAANFADPGALVCTCFSVGRNDIERAVLNGCSSVSDVGMAVQAGTNCGSCRSEILAIIKEVTDAYPSESRSAHAA